MIDLHCHIIPGVDDGAESARVACEMAAHAWHNGVHAIVATPHMNLPHTRLRGPGQSYQNCIAMFQAFLRQHSILIDILPGSELFAHPANLQRLLDEGRIVTLNDSRYLLVEFDFGSSGEDITDALGLISKHTLVPVIAHPERYLAVQRNPSLVAKWFRRGYIIQVNKGSLLGRLGSGAQAAGIHLLRAGLIHVIASDAHDLRHRPTGFQSLFPLLEQYCPEEYIDLLLSGNPRRILNDKRIPLP